MTKKEILGFFGLLDLEPNASSEDVKRAYREMAKVWHPDRFPDDIKFREKSEKKMQKINEAYEKLQEFFNNPNDYKFNNSKKSEEPKAETSNRSDTKVNSERKANKEKKPQNSRISEVIIQAEFDKNSMLNSLSFGWSVILGAILVIAWNILRWMPFLKSDS